MSSSIHLYMTIFWIIAILLFVLVIFIIAKLTLKKFKAGSGERVWKLWYGKSTYWQIVALCSLCITMLILFGLKWVNVLEF